VRRNLTQFRQWYAAGAASRADAVSRRIGVGRFFLDMRLPVCRRLSGKLLAEDDFQPGTPPQGAGRIMIACFA